MRAEKLMEDTGIGGCTEACPRRQEYNRMFQNVEKEEPGQEDKSESCVVLTREEKEGNTREPRCSS